MLIQMCVFCGHAHYISYSDKNSVEAGKYFAYATLNSEIFLC